MTRSHLPDFSKGTPAVDPDGHHLYLSLEESVDMSGGDLMSMIYKAKFGEAAAMPMSMRGALDSVLVPA
jgi:hypothetical protein